jgi:hypothetical protein
MNRQTYQNGKPRSTITWVATVVSLALLVASLALALGSGEAVAENSDPTPSDTKTIWIKDDPDQKGTHVEPSDGQRIEWHFVITQIANRSLAPGSNTTPTRVTTLVETPVPTATIDKLIETPIATPTLVKTVVVTPVPPATVVVTPVTPVPTVTPVGTPVPTVTPVGTPVPTRTPPRATPSPVTTPVSESAGATAMPTSVSEALPAAAEPTQTPQPPAVAGQVLPKTGGGPGGSILLGLLGLVGSVLAATGFALEARRRRAMR